MQAPGKQQGLTMIELMIAMTIGLLIMIGMGSLFTQTKQSFRQDETIARMQEDARFAMSEMSNDMGMAGFFGPLVNSSTIDNSNDLPSTVTNADVTKVFSYSSPALAIDDVESSAAFDWATGLDDFQKDSDAISIHRVEGIVTPAAGIAATRFYLQTNGTIGVMVPGSTPSTAVPAPFEYWEYIPVIYYVRTYCRSGDGIPSLVRRYLKAGVVTTECIARGIESLQIEYGIDTNGDGWPNQYVDDISTTNAAQLATMRIYLLARATEMDRRYENDKKYTIANYTLDKSGTGASDHFYRRVYTTTIQTRNPTAARLID